jgi:hypothetical protein
VFFFIFVPHQFWAGSVLFQSWWFPSNFRFLLSLGGFVPLFCSVIVVEFLASPFSR